MTPTSRIRTTVMCLATLWAAAPVFAAPGATPLAAKPTALTHDVMPLKLIDMVEVNIPDRQAISAEDDLREAEGRPPRYAIPNPVRITPWSHGQWETLPDGSRLWRLRVSAPGAVSINLGFTRYHMPEGGRLYLYSTDYRRSIRPFTSADNHDHGQLWTPVLLAEQIVLEVTLPDEAAVRALELELTSVNYGYRGFGSLTAQGRGATPRSGSCNVDVVCPEGDLWRNEIPAIAVISTGGSTFCTGFMVNNTAYDLTPYFMTANHCGINSGNAPSLVAYWNYENSTCRVPGSPESGGPGDGTLNQFNTGSTFRAAYSPSDFTLVELSSPPNPAFNVSYAGWDHSSADATSAVGIHHPNTDEKRISFENDPTTTTAYLGTAVPGDGTHVRITQWDLGTTEPGSSGSPLFNQDHRVIGQLHGGYASCTSLTSDWYGRFSVSWTGGGSPSTRLSDWLDAGNTGAMFVDTISGLGMSVTPGGDVIHFGDVGGPFTNPITDYTLNNPSPNPISYRVSLAAGTAPLFLNGSTADVTGILPATGGTAIVSVTLDAPETLLAGVYTRQVLFEDLTNGQNTTRLHTIEVGQTLFSVSPTTDLLTGGPTGGPFPGSQVYTVTSDRPTPVQVQVAASDTWISLDGGAGPVTLNLVGTGSSDVLTVGIDPSATALPPGIYNGVVTFTNLSGGGGDTTRNVTLEVGRVFYASTDTPLAISDNSTVVSTIDVLDDFCIGDVDVDIDITHTYIGDLRVTLQSPSGTTVTLHDRTGGSADNIVTTYDDATNPPDGPGQLGDFNFGPSLGIWTLTVSDNASGDVGSLNLWALHIAAVGGNCPTPQLIYSYPLTMDPGWSIEGQWAWGKPTGGGGSSGSADPLAGFTGTSVYGYNLNGDYPNNMASAMYLTTPAIDCTGLTNTTLKFRRWLGVESATYDHASIQASNDGVNWTTVWDHTGSSISGGTWELASHNIAAVADGQSTVYIRWGMGPTDGSVTYCGWNIDDVEIWAAVSSPSTCTTSLGDMNGLDGANGDDIQAFVSCYLGGDPGATGCPCADMNTSGAFEATDVSDFVTCLLGLGCP